MKKINLTICILLTFLLTYSYNWPTNERIITGTFGEPRREAPFSRFHAGVDIAGNKTTEIYAIENGIYRELIDTESVRIGDFRYIHLNLAPYFYDTSSIGDTINRGDLIGTIDSNHIHLDECYDGQGENTGRVYYLNPLRSNGLENYIDNSNPIITDTIKIFGDTVGFLIFPEESFSNKYLLNKKCTFGNIDIMIPTKDLADNYPGRENIYSEFLSAIICGDTFIVNGYSYDTLFSDLNVSYPYHIHDGVGWIYDTLDIFGTGSSSTSYYGYWLTNKLYNAKGNAENRWWQTQVHDSVNLDSFWRGDYAEYNRDAKYKDGKSLLRAIVTDITGNADTLIDTITLDNFAPAVDSTENNQTKMYINCIEIEYYNSDTLITDTIKNNASIDFLVRFTERIDTATLYGAWHYEYFNGDSMVAVIDTESFILKHLEIFEDSAKIGYRFSSVDGVPFTKKFSLSVKDQTGNNVSYYLGKGGYRYSDLVVDSSTLYGDWVNYGFNGIVNLIQVMYNGEQGDTQPSLFPGTPNNHYPDGGNLGDMPGDTDFYWLSFLRSISPIGTLEEGKYPVIASFIGTVSGTNPIVYVDGNLVPSTVEYNIIPHTNSLDQVLNIVRTGELSFSEGLHSVSVSLRNPVRHDYAYGYWFFTIEGDKVKIIDCGTTLSTNWPYHGVGNLFTCDAENPGSKKLSMGYVTSTSQNRTRSFSLNMICDMNSSPYAEVHIGVSSNNTVGPGYVVSYKPFTDSLRIRLYEGCARIMNGIFVRLSDDAERIFPSRGGNTPYVSPNSQDIIGVNIDSEIIIEWKLENSHLIGYQDDVILYDRCQAGVDFGLSDTLLNKPHSLITSAGKIFIADRNNNYIKVFNLLNGDFLYKWGGIDTLINDTILFLPEYISYMDSSIWVYDTYGTKLKRFSLTGELIAVDSVNIYENTVPNIAWPEPEQQIDTVYSYSIRYAKVYGTGISEISIVMTDSSDANHTATIGNFTNNVFERYGTDFRHLDIPRNRFYLLTAEASKGDGQVYSDSTYVYYTFDRPIIAIDSTNADLGTIIVKNNPIKESILEPIYLQLSFSTDSIFDNGDSIYLARRDQYFNNRISYGFTNVEILDSLRAGTWYLKGRYYRYYDGIPEFGDFGSVVTVEIPDWSTPVLTLENSDREFIEYGRKTYELKWKGEDREGVIKYSLYQDTGNGFILIDSLDGSFAEYSMNLTEAFDSIRFRIEGFDGTNTGFIESSWMIARNNISLDNYPEGKIFYQEGEIQCFFKSDGELYFTDLSDSQYSIDDISDYDVDAYKRDRFIAYIHNDTLFSIAGDFSGSVRINNMYSKAVAVSREDIYYLKIDTISNRIDLARQKYFSLGNEEIIFSDTVGIIDSVLPDIEVIRIDDDIFILYLNPAGNVSLIKDGQVYADMNISDIDSMVSATNIWQRIDIIGRINTGNLVNSYSLYSDMPIVENQIIPSTNSRPIFNYLFSNTENGIAKYKMTADSFIIEENFSTANKIIDATYRINEFEGFALLLVFSDSIKISKLSLLEDKLDEIYTESGLATAYNNSEHSQITVTGEYITTLYSGNEFAVVEGDSINIRQKEIGEIYSGFCAESAPVLISTDSVSVLLWIYTGDIYVANYRDQIWSQPYLLADAFLPDSTQSGEFLGGYHSLSTAIDETTLHITGIYNKVSTNPTVPLKTYWFYTTTDVNNPTDCDIFYFDSLIEGSQEIPRSPVIELGSNGDPFIAYEKSDNEKKFRLNLLSSTVDSTGTIADYLIQEVGYGCYPDAYYDGWGYNVAYMQPVDSTIRYLYFINQNIQDNYIIDTIETGSRPKIFNELILYEKDNDIGYAQYSDRYFKYLPMGLVFKQDYSYSGNPTGTRNEDILNIYYRILWTEGDSPYYVSYANKTLKNIMPRVITYNGGYLTEDFIVNRDSIIVYDETDPYLTIDYSDTLLEYQIDNIPDGEYVLSTYYYYEPMEESTEETENADKNEEKEKGWDTSTRIMKTVNKMSNKEKLEIEYGTVFEDKDTLTIEDGVLHIILRKNSAGPVVLSAFILSKYQTESEAVKNNALKFNGKVQQPQYMGTKQNPVKDIAILQFALPYAMDVSIDIYDKTGRKVKNLINGTCKQGYNAIIWDGKDNEGHSVSSGEYFTIFNAGDEIKTQKMILFR